ncbi:MAG: SIS domain-containing protein [Candidatus Omnitrophica bacterium]|nr:SIS domain-containing protein [Candidatus Omnitrophota bacterium]
MPAEFLKKYFADMQRIFQAFSVEEFAKFISELKDAYEKGLSIFVFGNGGSGLNASHFASDLNKEASLGKPKRFKVTCLNDSPALISSYANDISYADIFSEQLKNFMKEKDLVIGISGSGNSENVIRAIDYANEEGARTLGICGFKGGRLKKVALNCLVIDSDDMQKVEDAHLIILHCAVQWLKLNLP